MAANLRYNAYCMIYIIGLYYLHTTYGIGYTITTPRRWTSGADSQVCFTFSNSPPEDFNAVYNLTVSIREGSSGILNPITLLFSRKLGVHCENVFLPQTSSKIGDLKIFGQIGDETVDFKKKIAISTDVTKTFVQTDKYLYKPSQIVKFRILTVVGPILKVSTEPYREIYVENPSGIRIAQWLNVLNTNGLIHKEFQLSEEPVEGTYKIKVLGPSIRKKYISVSFKVKEYVLPKYEVNIKPPKYVLGTTNKLKFKVCAKYTFGQAVKGKVNFTVDNGGWGKYIQHSVTKQSDISGCKIFIVTANELKMNWGEHLAHSVTANAIVIEQGTEVELKAETTKVDVSRTALKFKDISAQKFYKPELIFVGEIIVTFPDNSPAINETMRVCLKHKCKVIPTNRNGILKFAVPPHLQDESINVTAINFPQQLKKIPKHYSFIYNGHHRFIKKLTVMHQSSFEQTIKKYHSSSNSAINIEIPNNKLQCITGENIKFSFTVSFSAIGMNQAEVAVQVISRGQIFFVSNDMTEFKEGPETHVNPNILIEPVEEPATRNLFRGSFTKTVELPPFASPEAKLIVFYSRPDGEVVSDVRTVDITECLFNFVNLTWNEKKVQPGEEATLTMAAEPHSLCSLGVVDKSVQLLSNKNTELTKTKLLEIAQKSSVQEGENKLVNDEEYCEKKYEQENGKYDFSNNSRLVYHSDEVDALHMFDVAGIYVLTNMQLESRPCTHEIVDDFILHQDHYYYFDNFDIVLESDYQNFNDDVQFSSPHHSGPLSEPSAPPVNKPPAKKQKKRKSKSKVRSYQPETWLWKLVHLQDSGKNKDVLTLPDTITEWVGSAVCVHPTKGVGISQTASITTFKEFFADLTLPATVKRGEIVPIKISVFNYLNEALPVIMVLEDSPDFDILDDEGTKLRSGERSSCIAAKDKVVHSIRLKSKAIGSVNITVTASVDVDFFSTCGLGTDTSKTDTLIKPLKVEIEGFEKNKIWTQYICKNGNESSAPSTWIVDVPRDKLIIPYSARGFFSVVGNLMGPTIENLGQLIKMPYGCGEQNMVNFAPNVFVMPYLDTISTKDLAEKALRFMEKGYQRELNYRHKDGSYSAFGKRDHSGSTWLTAFVLKSFSQARDYISIDAHDVRISLKWLKNKQLTNGCFQSVGNLFNKELKGGLLKNESPSVLTSFVLISLLEAGEQPSSIIIQNALSCLDADKDTTKSYALSIKAYALALAKSPKTKQTLDYLMNNANISTRFTYWDFSGTSIQIETAGYAVLALLTQDQIGNTGIASSIIQWINNNRNGEGGFVSTQDTIVALQAISKFEEMSSNGKQDAFLFVKLSDSPGARISHEASFKLDESNKLLQQRAEIPFFPAAISFELDGAGCSLIQAVLRYNEQEPESSEVFNLNVTTEIVNDKNCATKRITACVSYNLPDLESNMGIIEVTLVSGYIPLKEDLKKVVGSGTEFFKRYEVDGNLVTFYVDKFMQEELCASFRTKEEIEVEDVKPGSVRVYDYYKPEYYVTEKYILPKCKTGK